MTETPPYRPTVEFTDRLAERAHEGQLDKAGKPYIEHPRAVARMLEVHGENAVMAGLLHDVVEDTHVTLQGLVMLGYPPEIVNAVAAVSRRNGETYMDMIRRAAADPLGCLVKLADNRHNSSPERLAALVREEADFLARRYAKARIVLESARLRREELAR
jgi:(p)ppGpp synthase/HD superfamily hydrolase